MTTYLILTLLFVLINSYIFILINKKYFKKYYTQSNSKMSELVSAHFSRIESRMVTPFSEFRAADGYSLWITMFTLNRKDLMLNTVRSLIKAEPELNLLVIDNGSSDGSREELLALQSQGLVKRLIFNAPGSVPQWQKCYNIAQAYKALSVEKVDYFGWIDDDIFVKKPFIDFSIQLLEQLIEQNVGMINFVVDEIQNKNHKIISELEFNQSKVYIKETFVGMFLLFHTDLLKEIGLPPLGEGINDLSVEDWYYSRVMKEKGIKVAAVDFADHLGYKTSVRESLA